MVENSEEQQSQTVSIENLQDELRDLKLTLRTMVRWQPGMARMNFHNMETEYEPTESVLENLDFSDSISSQPIEKEASYMKRKGRDAFNPESIDSDSLKTLKQMNRDADEAIVRASILLEDTNRFLVSRNLKPAR